MFAMEEKQAIIGILLIMAVSITAYFALAPGNTGASVANDYLTCCCDILSYDAYGNQFLVRSQTQQNAENCQQACQYYSGQGNVFVQEGPCVA